MPEHSESTAWTVLRMESLSWLNMLIAAAVVATAALTDPPAWGFWTAMVAGSVILVLEAFDEWAEMHQLASEVVGPESVVLLAGLWIAGTALVVGGSPVFVAVSVVGGLVVAASSGANIAAARDMEPPEVGSR